MFEYIAGPLAHASPTHAIVDIQGVGYRLHIPFNNYTKLPQLGTKVTFYISTVIREDAHKLYGFLTLNERDLFENLINISGIGPKTALALIGHMDIHDLQTAVSQGNISQVCKIPGIGKKTAERLIVEMRDKIFKISGDIPLLPLKGESAVLADAIRALINLGYNSAQAQKAVKTAALDIDGEPPLALLITSALRRI